MIISFGWTQDYLPPKGSKDTTRRIWSDRTYQMWVNAWKEQRLIHDAVSKQLCFGGEYIGKIKLIEKPFKQPIAEMPDEDLIREGGMVKSVPEFVDKYFNSDWTLEPVVIRFEFTPLIAPKLKQLSLVGKS